MILKYLTSEIDWMFEGRNSYNCVLIRIELPKEDKVMDAVLRKRVDAIVIADSNHNTLHFDRCKYDRLHMSFACEYLESSFSIYAYIDL